MSVTPVGCCVSDASGLLSMLAVGSAHDTVLTCDDVSREKVCIIMKGIWSFDQHWLVSVSEGVRA